MRPATLISAYSSPLQVWGTRICPTTLCGWRGGYKPSINQAINRAFWMQHFDLSSTLLPLFKLTFKVQRLLKLCILFEIVKCVDAELFYWSFIVMILLAFIFFKLLLWSIYSSVYNYMLTLYNVCIYLINAFSPTYVYQPTSHALLKNEVLLITTSIFNRRKEPYCVSNVKCV